MKHVVFWRINDETKRFNLFSEPIIVDGEDSLAATIQNIKIDPQTGRNYEKDREIEVFPYFERDQMALNTKTCETRIVKKVCYDEGILEIYNTDNPHKAELQKNGYIPYIFEVWDIKDCVPVDYTKARKNYNFEFETKMGKNPNFEDAEAKAFA